MSQSLRRRMLLGGLPWALAGCGLSERPFVARRQWPLVVARPVVVPRLASGRVLELRELRAGTGLDQRGLQTLQQDGSVRSEFYEEWSVPPAQAIEHGLRQWLAGSGRFAAVIGPGDRLPADLLLDGELSVLIADPAYGMARAAIAFTLLDLRASPRRVVLQTTVTAATPLASLAVDVSVQAQLDAIADLCRQIEGSFDTAQLLAKRVAPQHDLR